MKPTTIRTILILLSAAFWTLGATSCRNTVRGIGRDVGHMGDNLERAAE